MFTTRLRTFTGIALLAVLILVFMAEATSPTLAAGGQAGIVRGVVLDQHDKPVVGAEVSLSAPTGRYHTVTDRHGAFSLLGVLVDVYTVRIRKDGFDDLSIPEVEALGDQIEDLGTVVLPSR